MTAASPATTVKRYRFWILSGKGRHVGRFPVADGLSPDDHCELHYDPAGTCVLVREFIQGFANPLVRRPRFDERGRLISSDRDGPEPTVHLRNTYEYGPDGLLAARQEVDRDTGALRWRIQSVYDANGWAREQTRYEGDGRQTQRSVFEVDEQGFFTREAKYVGGQPIGHYRFTRDAAHREIERRWYGPDGQERSCCATTYDARDLPLTVTLSATDGTYLASHYTYDERGKLTGLQLRGRDGALLEEQRVMPDGTTWRRSHRPAPAPLPKGTGALGAPVHRFVEYDEERVKQCVVVGRGLVEQGKYIDALPMFQIAAERYPQEAYFPYALGMCSLKLYRYEAALLYFQRALRVDPGHAPSQEGLALAQQALPGQAGGAV